MKAKEMLLADALRTAIESEKRAIKQKKLIIFLGVLNLVLVASIIVLLIGG